MKAGDTFRQADSTPGVDENRHLWVVLSDPEEFPHELITVFVTTRRARRDQTCIIETGEHPFVVRESTVAYGVAEIRGRIELETLLNNNKLISHEDASPELIARIRMLLAFSPFTPTRIVAAAERQRFSKPFP